MKILMICTVELDKNGITTCILNYSNEIASFANTIDIVAPNIVSAEIRQAILSKGMRLFELPMRKPNTAEYFFKLTKIIKNGRYDIVHAHGNSCTLAIELWAARLGNCRVRIAHSHNTKCEHMKAHKLLRPFFEAACNGRFACSDEAGKWLFHKRPFVVIKNGIDLSLYHSNKKTRETARKQLGVAESEILLGHIGMFNQQKNHKFLLEVFIELCRHDNKYRLICIGDGENKKEIEGMTKRCGMDDKVIFTGNVNNIPYYLQAMDCLLLPSLYEGLPFVMVEAQAAGVASLVSDKVSREADICGKTKFLPLDISVWCDEIQGTSFERENNDKQLMEAGFDIKENAYTLLEEYKLLAGSAL